jgi:hypothetical protein
MTLPGAGRFASPAVTPSHTPPTPVQPRRGYFASLFGRGGNTPTGNVTPPKGGDQTPPKREPIINEKGEKEYRKRDSSSKRNRDGSRGKGDHNATIGGGQSTPTWYNQNRNADPNSTGNFGMSQTSHYQPYDMHNTASFGRSIG